MVSVPKVRAELLINLLAEVARTAHWLADNSEDCGDEGIDCQRVDFEALSDALGKCEELPELPDSVYVRDGWLRAADELRALLAQPAEQHQDEPVVRDERAEFEACIRREWPMAPISRKRDLLPKDDPCYGDYCDEPLQRAWVGWQMRAALERKP